VTGRAPSGDDISTPLLDDWLMDGLVGEHWSYVNMEMREKAKHELVQILSERSGILYEDVNKFIKQWAYSSNDDDMRSLAIQKAASELFDIPLSEFTNNKMKAILQGGNPGHHYGDAFKFPLLPDDKQKAILQAMYDRTQAKLRLAGFSQGQTIRLRRGMKLSKEATQGWTIGDTIEITGNALESWSVGENVAAFFGDVILEMDVPVEMIIGTARTGFGCLTEGEFVLLGSRGEAKIIQMKGGL
jgi:hypothetical protein